MLATTKYSKPLTSKLTRLSACLSFILLFFGCGTARDGTASDTIASTLALNPVGYWPAEEGEGEVLHDYSQLANHGQIYKVPWKNGMLDFASARYQWVEIPANSAYQSPSFAFGGWVFSRLDTAERQNRLRPRDSGAVIFGQPLTRRNPNSRSRSWNVWGKRIDNDGVMLRLAPLEEGANSAPVEVVSGHQTDVLSSVQEGVSLPQGQWQHIVYSYHADGTGELYINGERVHVATDVPYTPIDEALIAGAGRWGTGNLGGTFSMDGSLRELVFFDRALTAEEVAVLASSSKRPAKTPARKATTPIHQGQTQPMVAIDLPADEPGLLAIVTDRAADPVHRGHALLKLKEHDLSDESRQVLRQMLAEKIEDSGAYFPRVEDFVRNGLLQVLRETDSTDPRTQQLLGIGLAQPLLQTLPLEREDLVAIQDLYNAGDYWQALEQWRVMQQNLTPLSDVLRGFGNAFSEEVLETFEASLPVSAAHADRFLTKGFIWSDAYYSAYSQADIVDGVVYLPVVERVPLDEVQAIFETHLAEYANGATVDPEGKWSRVKIHAYCQEGELTVSYPLEPWLIFDVRDEKVKGWVLVADADGHFHFFGGQHNAPAQRDWLPGIFNRLGLPEGRWPSGSMYWVSRDSIHSSTFEFIGPGNPRRIDQGLNYMNVVRAPDGELYLFGRGGTWSWTVLRYNSNDRRWTALSGRVGEMLRKAAQMNPEWHRLLGDNVGPYHGPPSDGIVWAWQPGAYNFNRAWDGVIRGISFDRSGRMHLQMPIVGVVEGGWLLENSVYAWSDDGGDQFYSIDGQPLQLPMTTNPIPGHHADPRARGLDVFIDLFLQLLEVR